MSAFGGHAWEVLLVCLAILISIIILIRFWGTYMGDWKMKDKFEGVWWKMINQNFDINCLEGLKLEEIMSLLKSNVITWKIRRKIISYQNKLLDKLMYDFIADNLPLILTSVLIQSIIDGIKDMFLGGVKDEG